MPSPTDFARWQTTARTVPTWIDRNRTIGAWVPAGSSVLDLGAGSMNLRDFLPPGCHYQPADVVLPDPITRFVDVNAYVRPEFETPFDYVVASGVLEYASDPCYALRLIASWGRRAVVSYAVAGTTIDVTARRRAGWINDLTAEALLAAFAAAGLRVLRQDQWQSQQLFELESASAGQLSAENHRHSRAPVNLFRADRTNVGDWFSSPGRHLPWLSGADVDIVSIDRPTAIDAPVVIGGGGLFWPAFTSRFDAIAFSRYYPVVGWGLGENNRIDIGSGWVDEGPFTLPTWTNRCDLLGVRDYGSRAQWVPCASCLHPSLLLPRTPVHEVVVFAHKRIPIANENLPTLTNDGNDIDRVLDFLGSGHVVVTNSYHGAYWATLLGRAVVAMPFSSKFWGLRHRPVFCRPGEWRRAIEFARPYPSALTECRRATADFAATVARLIGVPDSTPPVTASRSSVVTVTGSAGETWSTPDEVTRGLRRLGAGAAQSDVACATLADRLPVAVFSGASGSPSSPLPVRSAVIAPGTTPPCDAMASVLAPTATVVVIGSEDPALDAFKTRLTPRLHLGSEGTDGHEIWIGSREDARPSLQAGDVPLVVCSYTTNTPYEAEAARLRASCEHLSLPYDIRGVPARGSWEANCAFKATFLHDIWHETRRPILWVDADATLHRRPDLLAGTVADFAVHKVDGWKFASGTIFFNHTPLAGRLLDSWERLCRQHPHVYDQILLDAAWEAVAREHPLTTLWLPGGYTYIYDHAATILAADEPVVAHYQASRSLKRVVSTEPPRPKAVICDEWRQARTASRTWRDPAGRPRAARAVGHPDFVRLPGSPDRVPEPFAEFEGRLEAWLANHVTEVGAVGLFGATWFGARLCARFRAAGVEPIAFIDADSSRHAEEYVGLPIAPAAPELTTGLDTIVIASVSDSPEIEAMLRRTPGFTRTTVLAAHHGTLGG